MSELVPQEGIPIPAHKFLGRGPFATGSGGGWHPSGLAFRCAACGELMPADHRGYFTCRCGAMHLDWDAGRFGSSQGDQAILVYKPLTKAR